MLVIDPTAKKQLSKAVANTYATTADVTPWEMCQQYQAMLEYTAEYPDAGRYKVAHNMLDEPVPQGRVRPWMNGGMPDAMRGVQICEGHGWLDLSWDGAILHNLTILIAWIFSGGSINDDWVPYLAVTDDTHQLAIDLLCALDVQPRTLREDENTRATEVRPSKDGSPLGRLLVVLGAPQGEKSSRSKITLPSWIIDGPKAIRLAFAQTYVTNRATSRSDRPNTPIQIREERSPEYGQQLREFLNGLVPDGVHGESESFRLSREAVVHLHQNPQIRK